MEGKIDEVTNKNQKSAQEIAQDSFEVKTMPERFLSLRPSIGSNQKLSSMQKRIIIGAVIIGVFTALMIFAAWLFLRSVREEKANVKLQPLNGRGSTQQKQDDDIFSDEGTGTDPEEILNTDAWLDFREDIYSYELKYPETWTKTDQTIEDETGRAIQVLFFGSQDKVDGFSVAVFNLGEHDSLKDWLGANTVYSQEAESILLDNHPSFKYSLESLNNAVYTLNGANVFEIVFNKPFADHILDVYDQILVNFRFVENLYAEKDEKISKEDVDVDFLPASDLDNDGLSDLEEGIYKTDKNNPDTDGDGYNDGQEVVNVYDPISAGLAKLFNSDLMNTYVDIHSRFNLIYPRDWQTKKDDNNIYFYTSTEEFIAVISAETDKDYINLEEWYFGQFGENAAGEQKFEIDGIKAIRAKDGLGVYAIIGENIYSFIYNIGLRNDTNFLTTFNMIIKSFNFAD